MNQTTPILRILHVGDLHYWRIPINPLAYLNKRILGVGNLIIGGRARKFRQELLPILFNRIAELDARWLLLSGDLSSTALPSEFAAARRAIEAVAPTITGGIRVVPGNHDCYLGRASESEAFSRHLGSKLGPVAGFSCDLLDERVLLLALNATTKNGLGSHGAVTDQHLAAIKEALREHHQAERVILLCHFPQEHPASLIPHDRGPQLLGGAALVEALVEDGRPTLWLHGHHHYRWIYTSPTGKNLIYLNAGAPALRRSETPPDLGFYQIEISSEFSIKTQRYDHRAQQWMERSVAIPSGLGAFESLAQ